MKILMGRSERMKKLKIGVICYPTLGGSGVVATELAIKMAEKGHQIHFITPCSRYLHLL